VGSKVEQFAAIRRDHRVDGMSIRALTDKHHAHRRTMRQALEFAIPAERKVPERIAPRPEAFKKQRHTARPILARLVDEYGAVDLSYSTVHDYVGMRRPLILAEAGKQPKSRVLLTDGHQSLELVVAERDLSAGNVPL